MWDKIYVYAKTAWLIFVYGIDGAKEKANEELIQVKLENIRLKRELKTRRQDD